MEVKFDSFCFSLLPENPSPMAARTLMMVVKAIQNLANHVEFVANYKVSGSMQVVQKSPSKVPYHQLLMQWQIWGEKLVKCAYHAILFPRMTSFTSKLFSLKDDLAWIEMSEPSHLLREDQSVKEATLIKSLDLDGQLFHDAEWPHTSEVEASGSYVTT